MGLNQIKQAIGNRCPLGYYNGTLYKFVFAADGNTRFELAESSFKPWVLIISREYYQETLDHLSLTNQKEVKALLKLNNNHEQQDTVFVVNEVTDNQSFYNCWKFPKALSSALCILPEGLLLAQNGAKDQALEVQNEQQQARLYVAETPKGLYSAKPTAVLNSLSRFCQSCGLSGQTQSAVINNQQLPSTLLKGLRALSGKQWMSFWRMPQQRLSYATIKVPLIVALSFLVLYMGASSGYLYWQQTQLEQQLQAGKAEVNTALDIQDKRTAMQSEVESLSQVVGQFESKTIIWAILLPLYAEAKFDNIRYQNGRFILRGSAPKATELLAKLVAYKGVVDAQFDLPVASNRTRENFTISFRWQPTEQETSNAIAP